MATESFVFDFRLSADSNVGGAGNKQYVLEYSTGRFGFYSALNQFRM